MVFLNKLNYKFKVSKFSNYVYISAVFVILALAVLIYGLVYFMTDGTIDHGDHQDVRTAFTWDHNSELFIGLGSSLVFVFLLIHLIFWVLIFKDDLWIAHAIVNSKWYLKLKGVTINEDQIHINQTKIKVKKLDISKFDIISNKKQFTWKFWKLKFDKAKHNTKSETYKIALTAILLGLSVILSMLEIPGIPLPWGSAFMLRIFETMVLILAIRMVGISYTLIIAIASPWLHFAIHSVHSPIDVVFYMINNILVVFLFYILYYLIFNAPAVWASLKEDKKQIFLINTKSVITKKIIALTIFSIVAALSEALGFFGSYFLISGDYTSIQHKLYYDSINGTGLINASNAIAFISTLTAIFTIKYTLEATIFVLIEKKIILINRQFGVN